MNTAEAPTRPVESHPSHPLQERLKAPVRLFSQARSAMGRRINQGHMRFDKWLENRLKEPRRMIPEHMSVEPSQIRSAHELRSLREAMRLNFLHVWIRTNTLDKGLTSTRAIRRSNEELAKLLSIPAVGIHEYPKGITLTDVMAKITDLHAALSQNPRPASVSALYNWKTDPTALQPWAIRGMERAFVKMHQKDVAHQLHDIRAQLGMIRQRAR